MDFLKNYVRLIIIIKLIFLYFVIVSSIDGIRLKSDPKNNELQTIYNNNLYYKERFELLFKFLMSILLIYLFYPRRQIPIPLDYETRLMLCLFGFILILSSM